jgi:hypothetical protein
LEPESLYPQSSFKYYIIYDIIFVYEKCG